MDAKTKKRLLIWTSVLVVGGVAGYFGWKWWKDKKASETTDTETDTDYETGTTSGDYGKSSGGSTSSDTSTQPVEEPTTELSSWDKVKNLMLSAGASEYADKVTKITDQSRVGLSLGAPNTKVRITAKPDGMFYLSYKQPSDKDYILVTKGRYYKGGTKLNVGYGKNKGRVIRGKNFFNNLTKAAVG